MPITSASLLKVIKMPILFRLCCIFVLLICSSCISKVQWEERLGGTPEEKHFIPVCPKCHEVVDYESLSCPNPNCRELLTWSDRSEYSPKPYQPKISKGNEANSIVLPSITTPQATTVAPEKNVSTETTALTEKESPQNAITTSTSSEPDKSETVEKQETTSEKQESSTPEPSTEEDPWQIKVDEW